MISITVSNPTLLFHVSCALLYSGCGGWLNLPTGIYHFQGERWYGRTKSGAFVCQKEAKSVGDRATRNGQ